jgi:penicillin-binding protein 2
VGIGQGYNSFTPLQLAHAIANLSNNGVVMKPHLVKTMEDGGTKVRKLTVPRESFRIPLKQDNIDFIKAAMIGVTKEGTSARSFVNAGYESGGKTGTAQAASMSKSVKYDASKINERLRDHSLYIAFAPADKPRIALAVIVENAGFGAAAAAPIARMAIDYYLLGKRPIEPVAPATPSASASAATPPATAGAAVAIVKPKPGVTAAASAPASASPSTTPAPVTIVKPKPVATPMQLPAVTAPPAASGPVLAAPSTSPSSAAIVKPKPAVSVTPNPAATAPSAPARSTQ